MSETRHFSLTANDMDSPVKHLFIAGCPRSGTTALAQYLNNDDRIIVGIERYIRICDSITSAHFEKDNFLNPSKEETGRLNPDLFKTFKDKWNQGTLKYVGDKVPRYYQHMLYLAETFPACRILFLWRDLFAVASSYNVRAEKQKKNWNKDRDYRRAVADWNESLTCLKEFVEAGHHNRVHLVKYEPFFSGDLAAYQALYDFLALKSRPGDEQAFRRITQKWPKQASKPLMLDDEMKSYLEKRKDKKLETWADTIVQDAL